MSGCLFDNKSSIKIPETNIGLGKIQKVGKKYTIQKWYVKAFTIEDSDLILRLMTSAICTSGWMFLIPRKEQKGSILELKPNLDVKNTELL